MELKQKPLVLPKFYRTGGSNKENPVNIRSPVRLGHQRECARQFPFRISIDTLRRLLTN